MKKIIFCLFPALAVVACNNGSSNDNVNTNTNPVVTYLTESNMPTSVTQCYDGASSFVSNVSAINNNGVMTGAIQANPESGCLQQDYLFGNNGNQLQVIPPLKLANTSLEFTGARTAAISSNLITTGITFASDGSPSPYELATYNNYLTPYEISGANYMIGISENGTFIAGYNMGGQPTLFNTLLASAYNLTFNNVPMSGTMITAVSNVGIAVGSMEQKDSSSEDSFAAGILCSAATKSCSYIVGGTIVGYNAYVNSISSNSKWIYGYANNAGETQLFNVNLDTFAVTPLEQGFNDVPNPTIDNNVVTNTGDIIVKSSDTGELYLLVPSNSTASENSLYSIDDLAANLNLPSNVSLSDAYLSPNGNYIAFDVTDYEDANLFGVKVYFPNGIASYVAANLTPLSTSKHSSLSWFKGEHVVK